MKISEFEEKLSTVSDAKLRQMLSASRVSGPDVAVKLILTEGKRRGMDDLEVAAPHSTAAANAFERAPGSETTAYPQEHAGYAGADAPKEHEASPPSDSAGPALDENAPATAPDWLSEETKSGVPVPVKVGLVVVIIGAILGLAWKFSH